MDSMTPELTDVVKTLVDQMMLTLNVCIPGKIVKYNKDTQYADVQIQILKTYTDFTTEPHPVIPNVPVKHPRAAGGAAFVHMPLKVGDDVVLVFSHRSIDNWKTSNPPVNGKNGGVATGDVRKHHISDCFALIGGSAMPNAFKPTTSDAIEIVNGSAKINLYPDGKFKFGNASADLIEQVQKGFDKLSTDKVNTMLGPQPLLAFADYADIAAKLATLKE